MLNLYYSPLACSLSCHIALEEAGIPYETTEINTKTHANLADSYRAINPLGKVPALAIEGRVLTEAADHLSTSPVGPGIDIGAYSVPQNPRSLKAERGPAEFDITHRLVVSYIYELPWGRTRRWGQSWSRAANLALGDWQVSGIHVVQGGLPLTATLSGNTVLNLGSDRVSRPNLVRAGESQSGNTGDVGLPLLRSPFRIGG